MTEKNLGGRPQSPKTKELISTLQAQLETAKKELEQKQNLQAKTEQDLKDMERLAEVIRVLMRAMKGLEKTEDIYYGLIDPARIEERTRLEDAEAVSHSAMRTAAAHWPLFGFMDTLADMEDHYYISGDNEAGGLGRREAILMRQAQTKAEGNMILNMPNPSGGTAQTEQAQANPQPQKKKNIIQRLLHR